MAKEKKSEDKDAFEKTQVCTQTSPAILDTATNEAMTIEDAIVVILNDLDKIKKAVV